MVISKEEFQKRMNIYRCSISRLVWFTQKEQEELIMEADTNARTFDANFIAVLENLTFMRSIKDGKQPPN